MRGSRKGLRRAKRNMHAGRLMGTLLLYGYGERIVKPCGASHFIAAE
jgi:hypothetical protein